MTLKQKIEAIKALKDKISAGPWGKTTYITSRDRSYYTKVDTTNIVDDYEDWGFTEQDADFIIECRNTIFELIDAVKEADKFMTDYIDDKEIPSTASKWLSKYNGGE